MSKKKKGLLILITLISSFYLLDLGYLVKAVKVGYLKGHTTAYLSDYVHFDNDIIETGVHQPWLISDKYNSKVESKNLININKLKETTSYLIIQNDSIVFEKYYLGYNQDSISNSFSMAKSFVSAMLGKAISDGYIKGLDQPVSDFFKEFSQGKAAKLTVGDLSTMSSGLNYVEKYYSPFSLTARSYFTSDLKSLILDLEVVEEPGQRYKYLSSDTQLLGMILEKATGKNLSDYLSESFWKPMGAKIASPWQVDSKENNLVKAFCCIASSARDFARLGKLYKQHGKWKGHQLLDSTFIAKSLTPKFANAPFYGYGWWLDKYKGKEIFYSRGHLGQLTIVVPEDDLIIVRLGNLITKEEQGSAHSKDFYTYIDEAYNIIN